MGLKNEDVVYCGIMFCLLISSQDFLIELNNMNMKYKLLEKMIELTMKKLNKEDISQKAAELVGEREDINIFLELSVSR